MVWWILWTAVLGIDAPLVTLVMRLFLAFWSPLVHLLPLDPWSVGPSSASSGWFFTLFNCFERRPNFCGSRRSCYGHTWTLHCVTRRHFRWGNKRFRMCVCSLSLKAMLDATLDVKLGRFSKGHSTAVLDRRRLLVRCVCGVDNKLERVSWQPTFMWLSSTIPVLMYWVFAASVLTGCPSRDSAICFQCIVKRAFLIQVLFLSWCTLRRDIPVYSHVRDIPIHTVL